MAHPTLFDVPKDSPSRRERLKAFCKAHGIVTHFCDGLDDPWMACHMPSARKIGRPYGVKGFHTLPEVLEEVGRLLDEAGVVVEAATERKAVEELCGNLGMEAPR